MKSKNNVVALLRDLANAGALLSFEDDAFGGNTITINVKHEKLSAHTHCGYPDCAFEVLENSVVNVLEQFLEEIGS